MELCWAVGPHQLDVSGLEVKLSSLVDISAGQAGVVDSEGSHRHICLEIKLQVPPGVSECIWVRKCLDSLTQSDPPYLSDGVTSRYQSVSHQPNINTEKYQPAAVKLSLPQHQVMTPSVQGVEY